jgi:hypothetical protein
MWGASIQINNVLPPYVRCPASQLQLRIDKRWDEIKKTDREHGESVDSSRQAGVLWY